MGPSGAIARQTVLVVDTSNSLLLEEVQKTLADSYEILSAATVAEAIGLIKERRFDLVVTELGAGEVGLSLVAMARKGEGSRIFSCSFRRTALA